MEMLPGCTAITINGAELVLSPLKSIWWKDESTLIVSDVHIGKAAHFRKHGIAIPAEVNKANFWNLSLLLDHYRPERLLILGDLTHSRINVEWHSFVDFRAMYPKMHWLLVDGNHDLLSKRDYQEAAIEVNARYTLGNFLFVHDLAELSELPTQHYVMSGHVHPAVRIKGIGRQSARVDCFYFADQFSILPAFGEFTGRKVIQVKQGDRVYGIAGNEVLEIPTSKLSR